MAAGSAGRRKTEFWDPLSWRIVQAEIIVPCGLINHHMFKYLISAFCLLIASPALKSQENYNLEVASNLSFPGINMSNLWGYADESGREYALLGTSVGLSIIDVTDPFNPDLLFNVNGVTSDWREVRTWQNYAYVTTEGNNGGLTIIDLSELPDTIYTRVYRGDGLINNQLSTSHTIHIADAYAYVHGSNIGNEGTLFLNLEDPWNPVYEGRYDAFYMHDGFILNDTMWASHILDGFLRVVDVSDKSNPVVLAQQVTPNSFTHNAWLTSDSRTVLTTDEVSNSYLTAYDVSDLSNIVELDRYQTAPGFGSIVHNTHILNDYAVTSWYTEGVVIVDAHRPENLVEVAKNDFTPFEGDGFNGCWGVYPYFPSGNIIASDIQGGLFVLIPDYVRACYLEGIVSDSLCGGPLDGVEVSVQAIGLSETSDLNGSYKTGTPQSGTYTVTFSRVGYETLVLENVELQNGLVTELNVSMLATEQAGLEGVVESFSGDLLSEVQLNVSNQDFSYQLITDEDGHYEKCNILPGTYQIVSGQWGFITQCVDGVSVGQGNNEQDFVLQKGYYDDFQFNFGWTSTGDASSGLWVRAIPASTTFNGAPSNPGADVGGDCNGFAFVTGNSFDNNPGATDVDNGSAILRSPVMDLSNEVDPYLSFYRWFFNAGGNDAPNDSLFIRLIPQNGTPVLLKTVYADNTSSQWVKEEFRIRDFISSPGLLRFEMEAVDFENGHLVEAGLDLFQVIDSGSVTKAESLLNAEKLNVYPNPAAGGTVLRFTTQGVEIESWAMFDASGKLIAEGQTNSGNDFYVETQKRQPGIYLFRLKTKQGSYLQQKIIITE